MSDRMSDGAWPVLDTVGKNVRLKRTGLIHDHSKGGQLRFFGKAYH